MESIKKLIKKNVDKVEFIKSYLEINDMIKNMLENHNFQAVKELSEKKRGIITSIDVVDDKIVEGLSELKKNLKIEDISMASTADYPELAELKKISVKVLRLMVEVKESDEKISSLMDFVFDNYKSEIGKFDKKKLEHYTKEFFE